MTDQEVNKIIAEYMGWWLFRPIVSTYRSFWIHESRCAKGSKDSYVYDEYRQNRHKMISPENFECLYTKSLDALVPVWEKLNTLDSFTKKYEFWIGCIRGQWECYINTPLRRSDPEFVVDMQGKKPFKLVAHATAKAILELNKGEGE